MSHKDVPPETASQKACREWWEKAQPTVKRAWGRAQDGSYLAEETRLIHKAWEAASQQLEKALREEAAGWKNIASAYAELYDEAEARAEQLVKEVEALRAEMERSERYAEQSERERLWAEARAERLAEALETCLEMEERPKVIELARAALAAELEQDKGGGFWPEVPKNGGPDWTGFDG